MIYEEVIKMKVHIFRAKLMGWSEETEDIIDE